MLSQLFLLLINIIIFDTITSKCIWYEGVRDGFNKVYHDGEPIPLPLEDISLLNEMCPNIATREGVSPKLCCDRKQLVALQKHKYILDNLIGRCPSCYFNFLRILCEMACNPQQDKFIWPLEYAEIVPPNPNTMANTDTEDDTNVRKDWALDDYVDPDETENEAKVTSKMTTTGIAKVPVITKIRYFISYKQANTFLNSCWSVRMNFQYAIDVLCGSLNRACDIRKLFDYIGFKNTQSPIRIDFVFINDTYFDKELNRQFQPSEAKLFSCEEPVTLPHMSKDKCTCMDCSSMCPKINATNVKHSIGKNSTLVEKFQTEISNIHPITLVTMGLCALFVLSFILGIFIMSLWISKHNKKNINSSTIDKDNMNTDEVEKLNLKDHQIINNEDARETSYSASDFSTLERLGMKIG